MADARLALTMTAGLLALALTACDPDPAPPVQPAQSATAAPTTAPAVLDPPPATPAAAPSRAPKAQPAPAPKPSRVAVPSRVVTPGSFCDPPATGVTSKGTAMVCGVGSDGRDRWKKA